MTKKEYAPICVSTYARKGHLERAIGALKKNIDAEKHALFVFSDGPRAGDEAKVEEVRKFIKNIDGFRKVTIFERAENDRIRNNRGGMKEVLGLYGRIIFLEEDIVTAPGFLRFINDALQRYQHEKNVFSVCGWTPRFKKRPKMPEGSSFFSTRFAGWGFGIWSDRFAKINEIGEKGYREIKTNLLALQRIKRYMGRSVIDLIREDASGRINALDVRACFHQAITGELSLYPYPSLTANIGLDGTGEHCGVMPGLNIRLAEDLLSYQWPEVISVNEKMASLYVSALHDSFPRKMFCAIQATLMQRRTKDLSL